MASIQQWHARQHRSAPCQTRFSRAMQDRAGLLSTVWLSSPPAVPCRAGTKVGTACVAAGAGLAGTGVQQPMLSVQVHMCLHCIYLQCLFVVNSVTGFIRHMTSPPLSCQGMARQHSSEQVLCCKGPASVAQLWQTTTFAGVGYQTMYGPCKSPSQMEALAVPDQSPERAACGQ